MSQAKIPVLLLRMDMFLVILIMAGNREGTTDTELKRVQLRGAARISGI